MTRLTKAEMIQGDVFTVLPTLPRGSVDTVVTSPPYYRLRAYLPADHPLKALELGSEESPEQYVANLVRAFGLVRECMADHAVAWINCGDTYASSSSNQQGGKTSLTGSGGAGGCPTTGRLKRELVVAEGNLCLIPWRLALALQADGWFIRSVMVWRKPAAMPSSVAGWRWMRCRVKRRPLADASLAGKYAAGSGNCQARPGSGGVTGKMPSEYQTEWDDCPGCPKCSRTDGYVLRRGSWRPTTSWEPILMLAKSVPYFCDGESVKTAPAAATLSRDRYTRVLDDPNEQFAVRHDHETQCVTGANPRDVWRQKLEDMTREELIELVESMRAGQTDAEDLQTWAAEPLKDAHYAAYPSALASFLIRASTSQRGYCVKCSKPWCRVLEVKCGTPDSYTGQGERAQEAIATGWRPSCTCPDAGEPRPGLILDPFAGSGRTGIAARRLGMDFVGIELNEQYAAMARRLIREDMPLFSRQED